MGPEHSRAFVMHGQPELVNSRFLRGDYSCQAEASITIARAGGRGGGDIRLDHCDGSITAIGSVNEMRVDKTHLDLLQVFR